MAVDEDEDEGWIGGLGEGGNGLAFWGCLLQFFFLSFWFLKGPDGSCIICQRVLVGA